MRFITSVLEIKDISHDFRHNLDGAWKLDIDYQRLKAKIRDSGVYDSDYSNVLDGEYYYGSDYLRVCTLDAKDLPGFYKDHWLIDSGALDHIMPHLEDFSNLAQEEHLLLLLIKMHGPGIIVLNQDHRSAPPVTLTGVWYAPEAAHHLLSVTALTNQGFQCEITDRTKIWDNQECLIIQSSALLSSTSPHWFQSFLITPESKVHSLQDNKSYDL